MMRAEEFNGHRRKIEGLTGTEKLVSGRCRKADGSSSLLPLTSRKRTHCALRGYAGKDRYRFGSSDVPAFHGRRTHKKAEYTDGNHPSSGGQLERRECASVVREVIFAHG